MCDVLIQIGSRNNGKGRKYSPIKPVYALLTQTADFLTARPSLSKVCVIELYNQDVQFSGTMSQQKITKAKNIFVNLLKKHGDTCAYWKSLNTLTWAPRDPPLRKTKQGKKVKRIQKRSNRKKTIIIDADVTPQQPVGRSDDTPQQPFGRRTVVTPQQPVGRLTVVTPQQPVGRRTVVTTDINLINM